VLSPEGAAPSDPADTGTAAPVKPATPAVPAKAAAQAEARTPPVPDLFARHTRAYSADCAGRPVAILHAGATTASDLGAGALRATGSDIVVSLIDEDEPVTRDAVARSPGLAGCIVGDLRTVPLNPRAFDIVQCASLLGRINHAELILDRLIGAIKPGGLLLLRVGDRESAGGFLDRRLPETLRRMIWRKRHPGEPGPYPAVYEQLSSARGVQAYALLRGLVIAERRALGGLAGGLPPGPHGYLAAQKMVARLSRGRLTVAHEEMLYVLRKPESRFARIL
jgi:SAM-dependent methyltransferase